MTSSTDPIILCFSGHDPTGGAGIQADIEAGKANNAQVMTVITALTSQNTKRFGRLKAVKSKFMGEQVDFLLEEFTPQAIKIGMLAYDNIYVVKKVCQNLSDIPLVLDPILKSGTGSNVADPKLLSYIIDLLPLCEIITPNKHEIDALGKTPEEILELGCKNILLTTTDSADNDVITHIWFSKDDRKEFTFPKLNNKYHGSGCTLAASVAANLANHVPMKNAVVNSLNYTYQTLQTAKCSGSTQLIPNRSL